MTKNRIIFNVVLMAAIFLTSCRNRGSNKSYTQNESSNLDEVTIGTQVWMTKNLDVDTFRNGDPIPQAIFSAEWEAAWENKQPAWCYKNNDPANGAKYGKLYNWYAVNDSRGLAPAGYHIPSDAEWKQLTDFLGSEACNKMKSTRGWNSYTNGGSKTCPNCEDWNVEYRKKVPCHTCKDTRSVSSPTVTHSGNGTNSSGFSGLPGGSRITDGTFDDNGYGGFWWSSTEGSAGTAWQHALYYNFGDIYSVSANKGDGRSVRCLRD